MTTAEARIVALLEAASRLLDAADIACDAAGVGPFRRRVRDLALEARRAHLDGISEISKRPRRQPTFKRRRKP